MQLNLISDQFELDHYLKYAKNRASLYLAKSKKKFPKRSGKLSKLEI